MTLYATFLFVHFLGIVGLFAAGLTMLKAGSRLRRAATVEEARVWLGLARSVTPFFPVSGLLLIVTGLHMAGSAWSFGLPWVVVGLLTVVVLLALGPFVQRPRFMAMGKAAMVAAGGSVPADLRAAATDPFVWGLVYTGPGAAIGLLWIMTQKPVGWAGAALPVLALAGLGFFLGSRAASNDRRAASATGSPVSAGASGD